MCIASSSSLCIDLISPLDPFTPAIKIPSWPFALDLTGCTQTIIIERADGLDKADPSSYEVTGGPLRLEFKDLFLQEAENHQNEGDVLLSTDVLRHYAVMVWRVI